jgi:hypothetical protein
MAARMASRMPARHNGGRAGFGLGQSLRHLRIPARFSCDAAQRLRDRMNFEVTARRSRVVIY